MRVNYHSTMYKITIKPLLIKKALIRFNNYFKQVRNGGQVKIIMVSSFVDVVVTHMEDMYGIHPVNIGRLFTVVIINIKVKKNALLHILLMNRYMIGVLKLLIMYFKIKKRLLIT